MTLNDLSSSLLCLTLLKVPIFWIILLLENNLPCYSLSIVEGPGFILMISCGIETKFLLHFREGCVRDVLGSPSHCTAPPFNQQCEVIKTSQKKKKLEVQCNINAKTAPGSLKCSVN